jgi:hypothetical protein
LVICFPFGKSYKKLDLPNSWNREPETIGIFTHHSHDANNLAGYEEINQMVRHRNMDVPVPGYIIRHAIAWFSGKHITNYGITSYISEFGKFWNNSANSQFEQPTQMQIQCAYFHAARAKQMTLVEQIGENYDVLNAQSDIVQKLNNLPKYLGLYGLLKWLADTFLPEPIKKLGQDFIDNWQFTGFTMGLPAIIKETLSNGVYFLFNWLFSRWQFMPMQVFKSMDPVLAPVFEEILKTLPGVGLAITMK